MEGCVGITHKPILCLRRCFVVTSPVHMSLLSFVPKQVKWIHDGLSFLPGQTFMKCIPLVFSVFSISLQLLLCLLYSLSVSWLFLLCQFPYA